MIRETGSEPATDRPPAGAIQAHPVLLGTLERCPSCSELRSGALNFNPGLHPVSVDSTRTRATWGRRPVPTSPPGRSDWATLGARETAAATSRSS